MSETLTNSDNKVSSRLSLTNGLALFTMFFGAGNLIFPTQIGALAGQNLAPATVGFLITAVLLPILGVIAVATSGHGITGLCARVGKSFGLIFPLIIFLSIGPLYAIPRVASFSYELSFGEPENSWWSIYLYLIAFFAVSIIATMNPGKLVPRLGKIFTPILLTPIVLLAFLAFFMFSPSTHEAVGKYAIHPLSSGLNEGYLTLDALASLVFGVVILQAVQSKETPSKPKVFRSISISAFICATSLTLVYIALATLGSRTGAEGEYVSGAQVLAHASQMVFGTYGATMFAIIVIVACITTAFGLLNSCATYFMTLWPKPGYRGYLVIQAIISILIAAIGLNSLLTFAGILLGFIYPIAIMLILVTILDAIIPGNLHRSYQIAINATILFSLIETVANQQLWSGLEWIKSLPLGAANLAWLIPSLVCIITGLALDALQGRIHKPH